MKKIVSTLLFSMLLCCAAAQTKKNPVIKGFGTVLEVPFAVERPDPNRRYPILVDVTLPSLRPDTLNEALDNVARLVNLHVMGGVPLKNLNVVLAVHSGAAVSLMNNDAYQQRFKTNNPNLALIEELNRAGVKIFVCGQTLFKRDIDPQRLAPGIKVATSALTTLTTYQLKGYALLKW